jgi:hypothetical protein
MADNGVINISAIPDSALLLAIIEPQIPCYYGVALGDIHRVEFARQPRRAIDVRWVLQILETFKAVRNHIVDVRRCAHPRFHRRIVLVVPHLGW